ncbi:DUF7139 domain-containing protein [Halobaculum sp. EA56]|uniref:DUF7139 domain-containing protein n=1 Tax=Halobaculum sp. EA56 TaxID=3421648 RepID=UPI003EC028FB
MSQGPNEEQHDLLTRRLLRLYRRYLGEPDQLSDVYVGFSFFFGGISMGVVGVLLFLWSSALPPRPGLYWQLREIAISLSMLALPVFLLGVVVLLPSDRRALAGGTGGVLVTLGAVSLFVVNYPQNWNAPGPDASATGVTVYAVGVVLATTAVGAALVSNYIRRASSTSPSSATDGEPDDSETVTDAQVRSDIDEARSDAELSWGGVEKDDTKRPKIRTDTSDIDRSGLDTASATERRSTGSDVVDAVDGLTKLRGGTSEEATGEGTDEQANALRELRERDDTTESAQRTSLVGRLRDMLGV